MLVLEGPLRSLNLAVCSNFLLKESNILKNQSKEKKRKKIERVLFYIRITDMELFGLKGLEGTVLFFFFFQT